MYDKRGVVESTLRVMGLDHTRVPVICNPDYRHTAPEDEEATAKAHADRMQRHHVWRSTAAIGNQPASGSVSAIVPVFRCATAASRRQWSHQNRTCNE